MCKFSALIFTWFICTLITQLCVYVMFWSIVMYSVWVVYISAFMCVWPHQVVQHPHQRLKLQLPGLPLVLAAHVDGTRCCHGEHSWFVFLLIQHDQVVYAASTGDGIHLNPHSKDSGTSTWWRLWVYNKGLFNHQTAAALNHPPKMTTSRRELLSWSWKDVNFSKT